MKLKWKNSQLKPELGKLPWRFRWLEFKRNLYGEIDVKHIRDQGLTPEGIKNLQKSGWIKWGPVDWVKPNIKWYRVALKVTRRYIQDMEGERNAGLPRRFTRSYKNFEIDCEIFVIQPFHLIASWLRLLYAWYHWQNWQNVYDMETRWVNKAYWISGYKYALEEYSIEPPLYLDMEVLYDRVRKRKKNNDVETVHGRGSV